MKEIPLIDITKLEEEGVITAKHTLGDIEPLPSHIDTAVIFFDARPSTDLLANSTPFFNFIGASTIQPQFIYNNQLVLAYSPLGGPAAGGLIEELIVYGVKRFIACGSSGLIGEFDPSNVLLVSKAIRDEGLSYHYLQPSIYVETSKTLTKQVEEGLTKHKLAYAEGISWTTDAFYRETKSRILKRQEQGAVAVEMECASMAAVCQYRNVEFAQVLYFSDIVKQEGWSGFRGDRHQIKDMINQVIIDIAIQLPKEGE